jgi:5-methylcytosine-specific restriction endonuclease McrA
LVKTSGPLHERHPSGLDRFRCADHRVAAGAACAREAVRARLDGALHRLPEFLQTPEWRRVRYDALRANNGRCELCGRNKHQLPPGEHLNVDHVHSRKARPDLALEVTNLAVLCSADNAGKGNRHDGDDWRHPAHPHRRRS